MRRCERLLDNPQVPEQDQWKFVALVVLLVGTSLVFSVQALLDYRARPLSIVAQTLKSGPPFPSVGVLICPVYMAGRIDAAGGLDCASPDLAMTLDRYIVQKRHGPHRFCEHYSGWPGPPSLSLSSLDQLRTLQEVIDDDFVLTEDFLPPDDRCANNVSKIFTPGWAVKRARATWTKGTLIDDVGCSNLACNVRFDMVPGVRTTADGITRHVPQGGFDTLCILQTLPQFSTPEERVETLDITVYDLSNESTCQFDNALVSIVDPGVGPNPTSTRGEAPLLLPRSTQLFITGLSAGEYVGVGGESYHTFHHNSYPQTPDRVPWCGGHFCLTIPNAGLSWNRLRLTEGYAYTFEALLTRVFSVVSIAMHTLVVMAPTYVVIRRHWSPLAKRLLCIV